MSKYIVAILTWVLLLFLYNFHAEPVSVHSNDVLAKPVETTKTKEKPPVPTANRPKVDKKPTDNKELGRWYFDKKGWSERHWSCLDNLWIRESSWNNHAQNPRSTAYGIAQFLDSTWAGTGYKKSSDPNVQIKAGLKYIENRYSTPCNAWAHFLAKNWY